MAFVVAGVIVTRIFDFGSIAVQESVTYMHGFLFMLCLGFAGTQNAHVRVDIFYRKYSGLQKAWLNLFGGLVFLLPFSVFLAAISYGAAIDSWRIRETSINAGGLPLVFVLKSLPPLAGVLLCLFAISDIAKNPIIVSINRSEVQND